MGFSLGPKRDACQHEELLDEALRKWLCVPLDDHLDFKWDKPELYSALERLLMQHYFDKYTN